MKSTLLENKGQIIFASGLFLISTSISFIRIKYTVPLILYVFVSSWLILALFMVTQTTFNIENPYVRYKEMLKISVIISFSTLAGFLFGGIFSTIF
jgi:hypothetical protein